MGHKIRLSMAVRNALYDLHGIVETDEIFISGKQTFEERRKIGSNNTAFFKAVEENEKGNLLFETFEEIENAYEALILHAIEKSFKKGYDLNRYIKSKDSEIAHEQLKWINTLTSNLKSFYYILIMKCTQNIANHI